MGDVEVVRAGQALQRVPRSRSATTAATPNHVQLTLAANSRRANNRPCSTPHPRKTRPGTHSSRRSGRRRSRSSRTRVVCSGASSTRSSRTVTACSRRSRTSWGSLACCLLTRWVGMRREIVLEIPPAVKMELSHLVEWGR